MTQPSARPGGRTQRVGEAVLIATRDLAIESAWPITVAMIATRAGVSEATIYRRWHSVENVLIDAATRDVLDRLPIVTTGDARIDLRGWARRANESLRSGIGLRLLRAALELRLTRGDGVEIGLDEFLAARRAAIEGLFADEPFGIDADTAFDIILAPIYLRAVFGYGSSDVDDLVERALREIEPSSVTPAAATSATGTEHRSPRPRR